MQYLKQLSIALAIGANPLCTQQADAASSEAEQLRAELAATRVAFEARIAAIEARLGAIEAAPATDEPVVTEQLTTIESRLQQVESVANQPPPSSANAFNPQISLILAGTWANLDQNPEDYTLRGFMPAGGEGGPGDRGFSLGETELTLSAAIDPLFYGQATFAVDANDDISAEEALVRTSALPAGFSAQFGRFYSALAYQNSQHAHSWDFSDIPLVYQAMFGGQYKTEGVQLKWLAPLEQFFELGVELGNGDQYPGQDDGNGVGAYTLFASTGDDIGTSASWKGGISWLSTQAANRNYEESDLAQQEVLNPTEFSGDSTTWSTYLVYKWAPDGNSRERHLTLQGEYFDRHEDGTLLQLNASRGDGRSAYRGDPAGWYLQGVYQFMPGWRVGLRYDSLDSGTLRLRSLDGVLRKADFPTLASFDPDRSSVMLDYSPTEFSRLRLQYAHDHSAPGASDQQLYLQYLMSLGAHGAHQF